MFQNWRKVDFATVEKLCAELTRNDLHGMVKWSAVKKKRDNDTSTMGAVDCVVV